MPGEQLVHRDAEREQVAAGIGACAVPQLGVHVARRAGVQVALFGGFVARQSNAEIEQAQLAVFTEVQVGGFHVAVNHAQAVQPAERTRRGERPDHHVAHRQRPGFTACGELRERLAAVPVEEQVVLGGVGHGVQAHEPFFGAVADTLAQPRFMREHRAFLRVASARRVQRFQRLECAAGRVAHLVEQVHAGVGHQCGDHEAVDRFAHAQAARHRQLPAARHRVFEPPARQPLHAHHERRGVVLRACGQRGTHDGIAGLLRRALQRERLDLGCGKRAVHAVGQQHEGVAEMQVALQVVDAHRVVEPHRAGELAAQVGVVERVVLREAPAFVATQQVSAGVAHVRERPGVATQRNGGQRAHGRFGIAPVVRREPAVVCTNHAVEHHRGVPRGRRGEIVFDQRHHARLGCHQALPPRGHAVGDRRDEAQALLVRRVARARCEVFVDCAGSTLRSVADVYVKAHEGSLPSHCFGAWLKQSVMNQARYLPTDGALLHRNIASAGQRAGT